jgi:hypothetical protein
VTPRAFFEVPALEELSAEDRVVVVGNLNDRERRERNDKRVEKIAKMMWYLLVFVAGAMVGIYFCSSP